MSTTDQWVVHTTQTRSVANGILVSPGYGVIASFTHQQTYTCPGTNTHTTKAWGWQISFPDGTTHLLPLTDYTDSESCLNASFTDQTIDGSGYTLTVTANHMVSIYSKSGERLYDTGALTDPNGNSIAVNNSTGVYTDTLGLTTVTATGGTYSWTDVNNGAQQAYWTNTSMELKSNFGCSVLEYDNPGSSVPTELTYPDGTTFSIAYEPTPGGSSGQYTGRPAQITLRAGGTIQYQYSGGNNGIDCVYQVPPTLKRITSDGTTEYDWAHITNGNTTTVTDQGGNKTIYTFINGNLTQVQQYQGASTLLTTDVYCYNAASGQPGNCASAYTALPITEVDAYHTINGMSTSSRRETQYDKYGNVSYSATYDFGATSPSIATTSTYGNWNGSACVAIGSNINDKPCDVLTMAGTSSIAETRYTYDSKGNLLGGDPDSHVGFAAVIQEDGSVQLTWKSGILNTGADNMVPAAIQPSITNAVQGLTTRSVFP